MSNRPIVISGFGRSGTTWLSDIISKAAGGLILFEPYHPSVCRSSGKICYTVNAIDITNELISQWNHVAQKHNPDRWLLRNHLRSPIEQLPQSYIDDIWEHCDVIGFKSIRVNHSIMPLVDALSAQLVYIIRHPLTVISSIIGRPRFWKEFGWSWHWDSFSNRAIYPRYSPDQVAKLMKLLSDEDDSLGRIAVMWLISADITIPQVEATGGMVIHYEDLYVNPYGTAKSILRHLNLRSDLHPAYLFEPSMTTLNTFHNSRSGLDKADLLHMFTRDRLSPTAADRLMRLLHEVADLLQITAIPIRSYLNSFI
ncbi:MAG: sulfotransferase [Bacteroidota bacterium]